MRFLVLSSLVLVGCSEFDLRSRSKKPDQPVPKILVTPQALEFGTLRADEEEVQSFTIESVGDMALTVSDIVLTSGDGFTVLSEPLAFTLDIGDVATIDVAFTPALAENFGTVTVYSDDGVDPEVPVELLGRGKVPQLQITPPQHDFGLSLIPCDYLVDLELKNVGGEDLVITEVDYGSGGMLTADASGVQLPLTLAPDEASIVTVAFSARAEATDTGELAVTSNDARGVVTAEQTGEGIFAGSATETFTEPGIPPVDVLFLIDQSCSMADDNQDDIRDGIPGFIDELQQISDYQLIQVVRDHGCAEGGIIDPSVPNAAQLLIDHAFPFVPPGQQLWTEALLRQAHVALQNSLPGGCNEGFVRPGSLLHVIVASDEPERSAQNWDHWVDQIDNFVADPALLRISGVLDLNNVCGEGANGYRQAANATGGATLNICNPSWGAQLTDIASDVLAGVRTYNLTSPTDPSTLVVKVNGVETTDFTYSPINHSVTVLSPLIDEGDVVEISYMIGGECT